MSTTIYHGLKFNCNMQNIMPVIDNLQGTITSMAKIDKEKYQADRIFQILDLISYNKNKKILSQYGIDTTKLNIGFYENLFSSEENLNKSIVSVLRDIRKEIEELDFESYQFKCEITLFPIKDYVLAIPWFTHDSYYEKMLAHNKIEFYGYWNNTDRDENSTDEEWKCREKDWDTIFSKTSVIKDRGFTINLTTKEVDYYNPSEEIINMNMPDSEARLYSYAKEISYDKHLRSLPNISRSVSDIMAERRKALQNMDNIKEIMDILRPYITTKFHNSSLYKKIKDF